MGVLKEKVLEKKFLKEERKSGVLEDLPILNEEAVAEEVPEKKEEKIDLEFLKKKYNEEAVLIAEDMVGDIDRVLLGGSLTYFFDDKTTGINGLSFSFKTLSSFEDAEIAQMAKIQSWDNNVGRVSLDLMAYEEIMYSLVSYCGFDLNGVSMDKKREKLERVPAFVMKNYVFPKFFLFREAFYILSNPEVYSFLYQRFLDKRV